MESKDLVVKGMSCGHCVSSIENSVGEIEGVSSVKVHLDKGTVNVSYDNDVTSIEKVINKIEDQGYDVEN